MNSYNLALIPGDGIGVEVTRAAMEVLSVAARGRLTFETTSFPWSCEYYLEHGSMIPEDGIGTLRSFDAIFLGALGWPATAPPSLSLHKLLLPIRKGLKQYANMRPCRLLAGVEGPLKAESFDILCIRETTEGEYYRKGGRVHEGEDYEVALETSVFTRAGIERILRFGFEQARARRGHLTSVNTSNAHNYSIVFWDEVTRSLSTEYPDVTVSYMHIDAIAAKMVMAPQDLDVVVASNLFGDVLTDISVAIQGGFSFATSANINPDHCSPSMFETAHGPAHDIAGKNIANPIAAIWSVAQMLDHLGENGASAAVCSSIETVTARGIGIRPGLNTTQEITAAVIAALEA